MASVTLYTVTPAHVRDGQQPKFVKEFFPDISLGTPAIMVFGFGRCKELHLDEEFPWNRIHSIDSSLSPQLASELWPLILTGPLFQSGSNSQAPFFGGADGRGEIKKIRTGDRPSTSVSYDKGITAPVALQSTDLEIM
ncbi:hypothetical protein C0992_007373 [Termitomyces sp. T32_za158]|nr:hypothetical protein C0992_007373 [Termitomyces sp. T32_za158]